MSKSQRNLLLGLCSNLFYLFFLGFCLHFTPGVLLTVAAVKSYLDRQQYSVGCRFEVVYFHSDHIIISTPINSYFIT